MERVLVVDDNEQNCELMTDILANWGYEVFKAIQGKEAINLTLKYKPDIILLDVMLPGMNGFEVCYELKNNQQTQNIPIVMLTVLNEVEDRIRGYKVGAEIFLSKPINYNELKYKIVSLIKQKKILDNMEQRWQVVETLLNIMEKRNYKLYIHSVRVKEYCHKVAKLLSLADEQYERLMVGACLHDVGKIINETSLEHVYAGVEIIKPLKINYWLEEFVKHHHEKLNGQGFPDGLLNQDLSNELQILACVNRFVELWETDGNKDNAVKIIKEEAEKEFWNSNAVSSLEQVLEDEKFIEYYFK